MPGKPHPPEFRAEAVQLVRSSGKSVAQIAQDLGICDDTLRRWVQQDEIDSGKREGLTTSEREELQRLRRENRILREERDILKKAGGLLCQGDRPDPVEAFRFVEHQKAAHRVAAMCRVLGVSTNGYYAWRTRDLSVHAMRDAELMKLILEIHQKSKGTYGAPRVHAELTIGRGVKCSKKRVARLMREAGLTGVRRRRNRGFTRRDSKHDLAPDLVQRQFTAPAPNRLWVADMTEHGTGEGKLYLAAVIDAFSRMVVGWAMGERPVAELAVEAVNMAIWRRKPSAGVIHHFDHGAQYTALVFANTLQSPGIYASMGSVGDALDNAVAESFFATLQTELLDRRQWPTRQSLRSAVFAYIEGFYNRHRRHSTLGYLSPLEFERRWYLQGETDTQIPAA
ncbi:MAG: IS3 family transposase [Bacillota bacterium]|nr:IS3 family transposase [Bacillota bacterium]